MYCPLCANRRPSDFKTIYQLYDTGLNGSYIFFVLYSCNFRFQFRLPCSHVPHEHGVCLLPRLSLPSLKYTLDIGTWGSGKLLLNLFPVLWRMGGRQIQWNLLEDNGGEVYPVVLLKWK